MRTGQIGEKVIKILLISVGVVAFLSVIVTTYNIFQKNTPEILNNCVMKPVLVSSGGTPILSRDDAVTFLESHVNGSFSFTQNTFDVCDPTETGYIYEESSNNVTYVLCDDGAFYKYESICTEGGQAKSLVSILTKDKSAEKN